MEMKLKKGFKQIILWFLIIGFSLSFFSRGFTQELQYSQNFPAAKKLIVIIIDIKSFFCPLCLEYFEDFCYTLHSSGQEEFALGILTYKDSEKRGNKERFTKIVEKQLRGFIIGNNIQFPIILDRSFICEGMNIEGDTVILFDRSRKLFKKYTFPLTSGQMDEIFSF